MTDQVDPAADIVHMSQRFRFLDLVQKIARADVDQCTVALGIEALQGMAAARTASSIVRVAPTATGASTKENQRQNRYSPSPSRSGKKSSSHRRAETEGDSDDDDKNSNVESSSARKRDKKSKKTDNKIPQHQQPLLDSKSAASIASRAAHEAAASVLAEIKQQQAQLEQIRQNQLQQRKELAERKAREDEEERERKRRAAAQARASSSSSKKDKPELRTAETDSSPVAFRTVPGAEAAAAAAAPQLPQPQHIYHHYMMNAQQQDALNGNMSAAAASPGRIYVRDASTSVAGSSAAASEREAAMESVQSKLAKYMAMEEEQEAAAAATIKGAATGKKSGTRSSSTSPIDITAPASVAASATGGARKPNPVLHIDDDGVPTGARASSVNNNQRLSPVVSVPQQQLPQHQQQQDRDQSKRKSTSPSQDGSATAARAGSSDGGNRRQSPIVVTFQERADEVKKQQQQQQQRQNVDTGSFSSAAAKKQQQKQHPSDVISPQERAGILLQLEADYEQRQKQQQQLQLQLNNIGQQHSSSSDGKVHASTASDPMFVRGAVLRQLDEWLAKTDAYCATNVTRHLHEAREAAAAFELRHRMKNRNEEQDGEAPLDPLLGPSLKHKNSSDSKRHGNDDDDGHAQISEQQQPQRVGNFDIVSASVVSPSKKKQQLRLYPRGFIPEAIRSRLQEAGKTVPSIVRSWEDQQLLSSSALSSPAAAAARADANSSALPTEVFCARAAEQILKKLFGEVAQEVDELCDDFVEGLVQHELQ